MKTYTVQLIRKIKAESPQQAVFMAHALAKAGSLQLFEAEVAEAGKVNFKLVEGLREWTKQQRAKAVDLALFNPVQACKELGVDPTWTVAQLAEHLAKVYDLETLPGEA